MCDEYVKVGRAAGEELWLTRSGKAIEGQFEVQIEECIVDSGASASTSHTARGLTNQRPSGLYFKDLTGITNGVTDGVANVLLLRSDGACNARRCGAVRAGRGEAHWARAGEQLQGFKITNITGGAHLGVALNRDVLAAHLNVNYEGEIESCVTYRHGEATARIYASGSIRVAVAV